MTLSREVFSVCATLVFSSVVLDSEVGGTVRVEAGTKAVEVVANKAKAAKRLNHMVVFFGEKEVVAMMMQRDPTWLKFVGGRFPSVCRREREVNDYEDYEKWNDDS